MVKLIETEDDLTTGFVALLELEPRFQAVEGPLLLRRRSDGFEALIQAIVGQQVSVAAAAAIWKRLEEAGLTTEDAVESASEEELRACGLSRPKIRYVKALAAARIDYMNLRLQDTDNVIKTLIEVPGIGRWTAEIYAKFALGHADVFAAGDLALQEACRILLDLPERPKEREMREIAEGWSPHRAVAARALWAYYRQEKDREGTL